MTEINPYQSPEAETQSTEPRRPEPGVGIWRKGQMLIVHREARLPNICLKTGRPADRRILETVRWTTWNDSGEYFIDLPFTNRWWRRHVVFFRFAVAWHVLSVAFLFGGAVLWPLNWIDPNLVFVAMAIVGATLWGIAGNPVRFKKVTETHLHLMGISRKVLNRFPEWPA